MQQWWIVVVFAIAGLLPGWSYFRAKRTGWVKIPAGFAKYGMAAGEIISRAENRALYTKITLMHFAVAIGCFLLAALAAWKH
jgi:hypothetical protein